MRASIRIRRKKIEEYINEFQAVSIQELSDMLGVSLPTIRRDLIALEDEKIIERFHGGVRKKRTANYIHGSLEENEYIFRLEKKKEEKKRIAQKAIEFIRDNDIVFMNSGTTVLNIFSSLDCKNITVVTNNVAAIKFEALENIDLILLGGVYNKRLQSLLGELTTNSIKSIFSNCTILGVNGLDIERGMTTSVYQECSINDAMIQQCNGKVILLADSSKIGFVANFVSAPLSKIDILITDDGCPPQYLQRLRDKGIEVYVV